MLMTQNKTEVAGPRKPCEPWHLPSGSFPGLWFLPLLSRWHLDVLELTQLHLGTPITAAFQEGLLGCGYPCKRTATAAQELPSPHMSQGLEGGFLFISSSSSIHSLQKLPSRIYQAQEDSKVHLR